jgi:ABC-type bacteriocin/lantibiotic exporter with double-glycine peptidase domain
MNLFDIKQALDITRVKTMESGILAIRFLKASFTNDFTSLADFGNEDPQTIRKAWRLANILLNESEVEQFKRVLESTLSNDSFDLGELEHRTWANIQNKKEKSKSILEAKDINSFKQILKPRQTDTTLL